MPNLLLPALSLLPLALPAGAQTYAVSRLTPPSPGTLGFGGDVDVSGTRAVVGSVGGAWIAERTASGGWASVAELVGPPSALAFGTAVALDGDRAVVGAPADPASGSGSGSIFVFDRAVGGAWSLSAQLFLPSLPPGSRFGEQVALDGDRIAVGAPDAPSPFGGGNTGALHLFDRLPGGAWTLSATLAVPDLIGGAGLGSALDLDGDRLVAGAPSASSGQGRAFLFERGASGAWQQAVELVPQAAPALGAFDRFGSSVAVHGSRAAVGAPFYDGAGLGSGGLWTFAEQPGGAWVSTQQFAPPGLAPGDRLGSDVRLTATQLVAGAPGSDVAAFGSGAAHRWRLGPGGNWSWQERLAPTEAESNQASGQALGFDGGWLVLGAPGVGTGSGELADVLYAYGLSGETAPANYGKGTAACEGLPTLSASLPPLIDSGAFELTTDQVPPEAVGLALLGFDQDLAGSDPLGLGVELHVDLFTTPAPLLLSAKADGTGRGAAAIPIPDSKTLAGAKLFAQLVWLDPECASASHGISASDGLAFTLAEP